MALRAFHSNPCIGGFGGESTPALRRISKDHSQDIVPSSSEQHQQGGGDTHPNDDDGDEQLLDGDVFCQIVKELVDNAVDACKHQESDHDNNGVGGEGDDNDYGVEVMSTNKKKRVKVEIKPDESPSDDNNSNVLQVIVSDNGCGMENIQRGVDAFQSSKTGHGASSSAQETAGRYGIGLTLCLVHGQRLVPGSYACITSATKYARHFTRAWYVVNTQGDSVTCYKQEDLPKTEILESGTCVGLLVPGAAARLAWPRLVNYFARFQLSLDLPCSLEIMAPTLSKVPIFVRPLKEYEARMRRNKQLADRHGSLSSRQDEDEQSWSNDLEELELEGDDDDCDNDDNEERHVAGRVSKKKTQDALKNKAQLDVIFMAMKRYLHRDIQLDNIAHASQPIRLASNIKTGKQDADEAPQPRLDIAMIVVGPPPEEESEDVGDDDDGGRGHGAASSGGGGGPTPETEATIKLLRMVNGIPMMDGAEASACGLVQGLANKMIWGAFGIQVVSTSNGSKDNSWVPIFQVQDSPQVAHFFQGQNTTHAMYQARYGDDDDDDDDYCHVVAGSNTRKRKKRPMPLLPARVRLGEIIVIVHIHADPSSLPLPTLSKGRLPLNHRPIDQAFQLGLRACLRSLQKSNPTLLLTPQQLRKVQRETCYVPAAASALARVVCNSKNKAFQDRLLAKINRWRKPLPSKRNEALGPSPDRDPIPLLEGSMAPLIEERLLKCLKKDDDARKQQSKRGASSRKKKKNPNHDEEAEYLDAHQSSEGENDDEHEACWSGDETFEAKDKNVLRASFGSFAEHSEATFDSEGPKNGKRQAASQSPLDDDTDETPMIKHSLLSSEDFESVDCGSETSRRNNRVKPKSKPPRPINQVSPSLEDDHHSDDSAVVKVASVLTENVSSFDDDSLASPSKQIVRSNHPIVSKVSQKVESDDEWW